MSRTRRRNWLAHRPFYPDEPAFTRDGKNCPRGYVRCNIRRHGYRVLQGDFVKHHDDCLDMGFTAGKAMRLTRRYMIERDWKWYRDGELDCLWRWRSTALDTRRPFGMMAGMDSRLISLDAARTGHVFGVSPPVFGRR